MTVGSSFACFAEKYIFIVSAAHRDVKASIDGQTTFFDANLHDQAHFQPSWPGANQVHRHINPLLNAIRIRAIRNNRSQDHFQLATMLTRFA